MNDLCDFQRVELLMALPPAPGDVQPSELMDPMKALMLLEQLDQLSILFMHSFLTHLPVNIRAHCVLFCHDRVAGGCCQARKRF